MADPPPRGAEQRRDDAVGAPEGERMEGEEREFTSGGARWRARVARRGAGGHAVVYLLPLGDDDGVGDDGVAGDDRRDRRIPLGSDRDLADLGEEELRAGPVEGTPLTDTEVRFRAPDGRLWLVQSVGPVWADDDVAEGLTGLVFTSLEGAPERRTGRGGHAGRLSDAELAERWRAAGGDDPEPARADDGAREAENPAGKDPA